MRSNGSDGKWTDGGADGGEVFTGLVAGTDYWFIVIASRGASPNTTWSGWSNWAAATTRDTAQPPAPPRYSAISAGDLHTCGLKLDGGVDCFGSDGRGQSSPPTGEFLQVAAGGVHTCGIKAADGTVACWGSAAVESPAESFKFGSIDSGLAHTCGVTPKVGESFDRKNSVLCWGAPGAGRTDNQNFTQGGFHSNRLAELVSAGDNHNCALLEGGYIRCWGSNRSNQISFSYTEPGAKAFSAGGEHTCWINDNGTAECKGSNTSGQISPPAASEGAVDQNPYTYSAISAGKNHTCAIEADGNSVQTVGTVRCWGSNDAGQSTPPSGVVFDAISAGSNHTCGLKADGTVRCWGDNSFGQAPNTR